MTNGYQSNDPVRTLAACAFAFVFSAVCVLGAVAPAQVQSATLATSAQSTLVA